MRRSIGSGTSSAAPSSSGGSNSSSSPPTSRLLLAIDFPSTSTACASSRRSATLREPTSGSEARKRSSRSPAASSGTRTFTHASRTAPQAKPARPPRDSARAVAGRPGSLLPSSDVRRNDSSLRRRLSIRGYQGHQQGRDADDDERVGEVERRPVAEVEEVRDVAEPHTIEQIRDAAADHEAQCDRKHGMT